MLLSQRIKKKRRVFMYMTVCGMHGLLFGILYAPMQAFLFGLSFDGMIAWIIAGFPFDIMHGIGNFAAGTLIVPMVKLLLRLEAMY